MKKIILGKKAVIFDLFHTLTSVESTWSSGLMTSDILGVSKEQWNEQLLEKSRDRLTGKERDPFAFVRQMARAINPQISDEVIEKATRFRIERMKTAVTVIPDPTLETLKILRGQGKKLGLLSNADASEMASWGESPLSGLFNSTVFSCEVGYVKPEREIYEISLRQLSVKPEESIFIGDGGSRELEGAKKLGITTVFIAGLIRELWPEKIEARKKLADFAIEDIIELVS
jgi:putative hydrolase of the HAD superfamily